MSPQPKPTVFSEKDWNEHAIKETEELGRKAAPMTKYRASKTLAEKAAWEFYNQHKNEVKWDVAVINPPFVFGPVIQEISSPDQLNTSMKYWWDNVVVDSPKNRDTLSFSSAWVDVRDLADAHILALEKESAGGERIIVSQGSFVWQQWLNLANSLQPSPLPNHKLPTGFPDIPDNYNIQYDTTKESQILGVKYRTKEETTKDILADFASRGW